MARKKTITREDILEAAFRLVVQKGFGHFTARSVAEKVGSSTQPIYLEFKNMDELKNAVYQKIEHYLTKEVFPVFHTGDAIIDFSLNYIEFALKEKSLYRAIILDEATDGKKIQEFSKNYFKTIVRKDPRYENLQEEELETLRMDSWIAATGIAALMSSKIIDPTKDQVIHFIQKSLQKSQSTLS